MTMPQKLLGQFGAIFVALPLLLFTIEAAADVGIAGHVVALSTGVGRTLAIRSDGTVWSLCWNDCPGGQNWGLHRGADGQPLVAPVPTSEIAMFEDSYLLSRQGDVWYLTGQTWIHLPSIPAPQTVNTVSVPWGNAKRQLAASDRK